MMQDLSGLVKVEQKVILFLYVKVNKRIQQ